MRPIPTASIVPVLLLAASSLRAQAPPPAPAPPNQVKVDEAIDRGLGWLKTLTRNGKIPAADPPTGHVTWHELVFYTMLSGGVPESDPEFQKLLAGVLAADLQRTYCVSLLAMGLNRLDPRKYQCKIAQCAQFLVDNQCTNGQWSYGNPVPLEKITPTQAAAPKRKDVMTPGGGAGTTTAITDDPAPAAPKRERESTKAMKLIPIHQRVKGPPAGDNSNSQYAALGLRACLESGIVLEPKVLERALDWWKRGRSTSGGGWGYDSNPAASPYGSMTAGALGSIAIFRYYLRQPLRGDPLVEDGMNWLIQNFVPGTNPKADGPHTVFSYYYLYGIERIGAFYRLDKLGNRDWYAEGANWILSQQAPDGSWYQGSVENTCWSILFLRRATKPLKKVNTQ